MTVRRRLLAGAAGILAALLPACHSAPTRLYMVEPVAPVAPPVEYTGAAVRVEAVHVPAGLDRMEIVSEVAPGEFKVSDLDRWIAPLSQAIRQALTADLAARLPQGRVIFPHLPKPPGTIAVSVEILEFNADPRGVKLQVSWLGTSDEGRTRLHGGTMALQTSRSGAGSASMAGALGALLAQLADRIVEGLVQPAAVDGLRAQ